MTASMDEGLGMASLFIVHLFPLSFLALPISSQDLPTQIGSGQQHTDTG